MIYSDYNILILLYYNSPNLITTRALTITSLLSSLDDPLRFRQKKKEDPPKRSRKMKKGRKTMPASTELAGILSWAQD